MRGHAEESAEVRALRHLREMARRFVGNELVSWAQIEKSEADLASAAVAYAATQPKPRKKSVPR
jgi:hypothetical protein